LTREQQEFNKMHNKCRVSVEHYFGAINRTFPAMKFTQNEKPQVSPIALKYLVAGLLTNFKTCVWRGTTKSVKCSHVIRPP
jgi:hypothetical protein